MPDPHSHSSHCLRLPDSSCRPEDSWLIPGEGATSWSELFLCLLPHLSLGGDPVVPCHLLARVQVGRVLHTKSKRWLLIRNCGLQQDVSIRILFKVKSKVNYFLLPHIY